MAFTVHAVWNTFKGYFECSAQGCGWQGSLREGISHVWDNQFKVGKKDE